MNLKLPATSGIAFFLFVSLLALSCKKNNSPSAPVPPPAVTLQISAISPLDGHGGDTVTITGEGFSTTPNLDTVYFNGKAAAVTFADDSMLKVTVPQLAGTGNVSVTVKETKATGPSFTYDYQGVVSTYAGIVGSSLPVVNGFRTSQATFNLPYNLTVDGSGNLYVVDAGSSTVRKIDASGTVSTLIANASNPHGVALDGKGNLYISENASAIAPYILQLSLSTGMQKTLAVFNVQTGPQGLAVDKNGNVYVADAYNQVIDVVTPAGVIATFAGLPTINGAQNGGAGIATFWDPNDIVFDTAGNLYVADGGNNMIRKITPDTVVSTLAGNTNTGHGDGVGPAASFNNPVAIAIDGKGNLYVADDNNNLIRMITPAGVVSTIAGSGNPGSADGIGAAASFKGPQGITCDANGNLWVSDTGNNTIRKITLQ